MGKLCMQCLTPYHNDAITSTYYQSETGVYQKCPSKYCEKGKIYNIDDLLVSTIINLNSKGFYTYSSCSGHIEEGGGSTYIEFASSVTSLPSLPEFFHVKKIMPENDKPRIRVYVDYNFDPLFAGDEVWEELINNNLELHYWSEELPFDDKNLILMLEDLFSTIDEESSLKPKHKEKPSSYNLTEDKQNGVIKVSKKKKEKSPGIDLKEIVKVEVIKPEKSKEEKPKKKPTKKNKDDKDKE